MGNSSFTSMFLGCLLTGLRFAAADPPSTLPASPPPPTGEPAFDASQHLTGDWFGLRSDLFQHGISIDPFLINDYSKNFIGGLNTHGDSFRQRFNLSLDIDTEKLFGWPGGDFRAVYQLQHGGNASQMLTGDAQNFSFGTDADGRSQIGQLWYEQKFFDDTFRIRVGKQDANTDFDALADDAEFINNSYSTSPTLYLMPSFPDTAMGIQAFFEPPSGFYLGSGVFDGSGARGVRTGEYGPRHFFDQPDDLFLIAEFGQHYKLHVVDRHFPGTLGIGGWYDTNHFQRLDGIGSQSGTGGVYLILDQLLWKPWHERPVAAGPPGENLVSEEVEEEYPNGIAASFSVSWEDPVVNRIDGNALLGLSWTGPIPSRKTDVLGFGPTYAHFAAAALTRNNYELAIETFYQIRFTDYLSLKPDLQYIIHPSGSGTFDQPPIQNALVFTMRLEMAF